MLPLSNRDTVHPFTEEQMGTATDICRPSNDRRIRKCPASTAVLSKQDWGAKAPPARSSSPSRQTLVAPWPPPLAGAPTAELIGGRRRPQSHALPEFPSSQLFPRQ